MVLRILSCVATILLALSGAALAGPWARGEGESFVAISTEPDADGNSYSSLYGEYGLTGEQTLGFELGYTDVGETSALFWLQHALAPRAGNLFSFSLGIGMIEREGVAMPLGQVAANWGRGFDGVMQGGWLALETRLKVAGSVDDDAEISGLSDGALSYLTSEITTKADLTLGLHATDRMMIINQFRFEDSDEAGFTSKLATTVVHDLFGPAKIELGIITPLSGAVPEAVKLGTWFEF